MADQIEELASRKPRKIFIRPFQVLIITMGSIFFAEVITSFIISFMAPLSLGTEMLLNSLFVVTIISPLFHYFVFKPLRLHIAEREQTEIILKRSEEKYRSLVDSTDDSIYLVDSGYRYLFVNKKHLSRLELSEEQILGLPFGDFHTPDETDVFTKKIDDIFATGESGQYEYKSKRDGRYFLQTFSPVKDTAGRTFAVTIVSKNITERKMMEEELRALSLTDELTGLYNRRGLLALAEQHLRIAHRLKKGVFMLYADLDNLKVINDTFGHKEGDRALMEIAYVLRDSFRESDIIARIGGDEFVVLPVGSTEASVELIKERLGKKLDAHNAGIKREYELSVSVGIPYYDPEHPSSVEELLVQGDKLMYEQKRLKKS
jgi:diguanylate cyclase (GGDEF)-like protein/PAS domain S-box-containing protein